MKSFSILLIAALLSAGNARAEKHYHVKTNAQGEVVKVIQAWNNPAPTGDGWVTVEGRPKDIRVGAPGMRPLRIVEGKWSEDAEVRALWLASLEPTEEQRAARRREKARSFESVSAAHAEWKRLEGLHQHAASLSQPPAGFDQERWGAYTSALAAKRDSALAALSALGEEGR